MRRTLGIFDTRISISPRAEAIGDAQIKKEPAEEQVPFFVLVLNDELLCEREVECVLAFFDFDFQFCFCVVSCWQDLNI